jgi:hypothetical protein
MAHTLKSFTDLVEKSRAAATRYYELAAEARKRGIHTKEQKDALAIAKELEKQVDETIVEIRIQQNTITAKDYEQTAITPMPVDRGSMNFRKPFSQPLFENEPEGTIDKSTDTLSLEERQPESNAGTTDQNRS